MRTDGLAVRVAVLGGALPTRILVVDDDELELALISDRLTTAGFEVARATNGDEALQALERQWFPVVITDWQMPVMDGIAFTEALRARGNDETYVIMLTMREATMDYERGYHSGVNDYLTKKLPDAELFARINAAFNTLALRRSLSHAQGAMEAAPLDAQSGAFGHQETLAKLTSEIKRAQRYGRLLSVMTFGIYSAEDRNAPLELNVVKAVVQVIQSSIRTHVDWVGRLEAPNAFAIVLPETGASESLPVSKRLQVALQPFFEGSYGGPRLEFDYGVAGLHRDAETKPLGPLDLIAVADKCRACPGHHSPAQLTAVQSSVGCSLAIICRHGYAVDEHCTLKIDSLTNYSPVPGTH